MKIKRKKHFNQNYHNHHQQSPLLNRYPPPISSTP